MGVFIRTIQNGHTCFLSSGIFLLTYSFCPENKKLLITAWGRFMWAQEVLLWSLKKRIYKPPSFHSFIFACSSIPVEGTDTFKDVYFKLVLWIEKLFHLFLPYIGYNILQMAAFIRIPLQTTNWLCAFRNGPCSSPLELHWNWWNVTMRKSDPSSQALPHVSSCTLGATAMSWLTPLM